MLGCLKYFALFFQHLLIALLIAGCGQHDSMLNSGAVSIDSGNGGIQSPPANGSPIVGEPDKEKDKDKDKPLLTGRACNNGNLRHAASKVELKLTSAVLRTLRGGQVVPWLGPATFDLSRLSEELDKALLKYPPPDGQYDTIQLAVDKLSVVLNSKYDASGKPIPVALEGGFIIHLGKPGLIISDKKANGTVMADACQNLVIEDILGEKRIHADSHIMGSIPR